MSVETVPVPTTEVLELAPHPSDEQIEHELAGILAATNSGEAEAQQMNFEDIAKLFLDAHNNRVSELQQHKRELVLDRLLENPAEAFKAEFLQLKLLYGERTIPDGRYDGTRIEEFCTQNHAKATCDYLFTHRTLPSGEDIYRVSKVFMVFGQPDLISLDMKNNELRVVGHGRIRGRATEHELEGDMRERVLAQFFFDTIRASAAQMERGADEREENDLRAKRYLSELRKNEYLQV